jgi:hypothetical protein
MLRDYDVFDWSSLVRALEVFVTAMVENSRASSGLTLLRIGRRYLELVNNMLSKVEERVAL